MTYFEERKKTLGGVILAVYSIFIECAVRSRVDILILGFLQVHSIKREKVRICDNKQSIHTQPSLSIDILLTRSTNFTIADVPFGSPEYLISSFLII